MYRYNQANHELGVVGQKRQGWMFCVDYQYCTKQRYFISTPVIEELLDELYGTTIFFK